MWMLLGKLGSWQRPFERHVASGPQHALELGHKVWFSISTPFFAQHDIKLDRTGTVASPITVIAFGLRRIVEKLLQALVSKEQVSQRGTQYWTMDKKEKRMQRGTIREKIWEIYQVSNSNMSRNLLALTGPSRSR